MTEVTNRREALDHLCREATVCRHCFREGGVQAPIIDIAQPRWIGSGYWASLPRVCVLMLNPGEGGTHNAQANRQMKALLERFRSGKASLDEVFHLQQADFSNWGKPPGRFLNFFKNFGLDIDSIALANVAWCATTGNKYPRHMLNACMDRFTTRLLQTIQPNLMILSGGDVHTYAPQLQRSVPNAKIFCTLHFAHRKGADEETMEAQKFRRHTLEDIAQTEHLRSV